MERARLSKKNFVNFAPNSSSFYQQSLCSYFTVRAVGNAKHVFIFYFFAEKEKKTGKSRRIIESVFSVFFCTYLFDPRAWEKMTGGANLFLLLLNLLKSSSDFQPHLTFKLELARVASTLEASSGSS